MCEKAVWNIKNKIIKWRTEGRMDDCQEKNHIPVKLVGARWVIKVLSLILLLRQQKLFSPIEHNFLKVLLFVFQEAQICGPSLLKKERNMINNLTALSQLGVILQVSVVFYNGWFSVIWFEDLIHWIAIWLKILVEKIIIIVNTTKNDSSISHI